MRGVIYLLDGTKPAARLVVSLVSLRRHYQGPIAVIATDPSGQEIGQHIERETSLGVTHIPICSNDAGRHRPFLLKTLLHEHSPFNTTVYLDCDTIVRAPFEELFELPSEEHIAVTRFCNWNAIQPLIARRIKRWRTICPQLVDGALAFGPAINTGVFAFTRRTKAFERWFQLTESGREEFIPDEIAMQLILPSIPVIVWDDRFNCSAKYGNPDGPDVRIVHYHGRKHVGQYGQTWLEEYWAAVRHNIARIREWTPGADRTLRKYLHAIESTP